MGKAWPHRLPTRRPPARYAGLEKRFLKRAPGVTQEEAMEFAKRQEWAGRITEPVPFATASYWFWFLSAAVALLLVACAPRPRAGEPAHAEGGLWCMRLTLRFDGRDQSALACGETRALCENANRRAKRFGGAAGVTMVGECRWGGGA
jgi:hypothetical protein